MPGFCIALSMVITSSTSFCGINMTVYAWELRLRNKTPRRLGLSGGPGTAARTWLASSPPSRDNGETRRWRATIPDSEDSLAG